MYRKLDLDLLVPNPKRTSRISRMFAKKLRHNIERSFKFSTGMPVSRRFVR